MLGSIILLIVALIFAAVGYRKTWYAAWAFLFNVLIAVYLGVMTAPLIVDKTNIIRNYLGLYSYAVTIFAVSAVSFILLKLFSHIFTSVFIVSFPKILQTWGAAVLGFISGSIITTFLFFLLSITPLVNLSPVKFITSEKGFSAATWVATACNFVHCISLQACPTGIDQQMEKILADWRYAPPAPVKKQPVRIADANSQNTQKTRQAQPETE